MISSLQHESRPVTEAITQLRASQRLLDTRLAAAHSRATIPAIPSAQISRRAPL